MITPLIQYLETLEITQGEYAGHNFPVFPWERRFLTGAFAPDVQTAALSIARGNGKTTLLAAVAAAATAGPLAQPRSEVVIVASSLTQAKILWDSALAFLEPVIQEDRKAWSITNAPQKAVAVNKRNGVTLRAIGSDPKRAHGLAPALVLADEPAQWPASTSAAMLAALITSLGKIPNSRLIALGTMPADPNHWFTRWAEGAADYSQLHQSPKEGKPYQLKTWHIANPSLRYLPTLRRTLKAEAARAKKDDSAAQHFKALRLNQGTSDVLRQELVSADVWADCETSQLPPATGPAIWGIDLGSNAAMSAIACYWPQTGRLECLACFPQEPSLAQRGINDNVGNLYERMAERGELLIAGKRTVDISELLAIALDRFGTPAALVADRWREAELMDAAEASEIPPANIITRGQGYKDGGEDVRLFRRAALDGHIKTPVSLLMRSAMAGAVCVSDPAGNSKLAKKNNEASRRDNHRDDSVAAAILAVAEGKRQPDKPKSSKGYIGLVQ